MRLATIQTPYGLRVGAAEHDGFLDLQGAAVLRSASEGVLLDAALERAQLQLPAEMMRFLDAGEAARAEAEKALAFARSFPRTQVPWYPLEGTKLGPVVPNPKNIYILRGNYRSHRLEVAKRMKINTDKPARPYYYTKPATAVIGHEGKLMFPRISKEVQHEVELVVVLGKAGRHIPVDHADDYIAGYTVGLDMSARDHLGADGDARWKSFDTFFPTGPWIVPLRDVGNPNNLNLKLRVNGQPRQDGSTNEFDFTVAEVVSFISEAITLQPGDMISTGTPAGAGPVVPGDVIEAEIEKIGLLRCSVVAEDL